MTAGPAETMLQAVACPKNALTRTSPHRFLKHPLFHHVPARQRAFCPSRRLRHASGSPDAGDDPVNGSDPSGDRAVETQVIDRCVYFVCIALAGIKGTAYVYWIDVYELTGEIDGEENVEPPTYMDIVYNKNFSAPAVREFIPNPYIGLHAEYYVNADTGTYTGVIEYFEGVDGEGPNPTVTVKGKDFWGWPPPAPPDPRPVDYFGSGTSLTGETNMSAGRMSSNSCNRAGRLVGVSVLAEVPNVE